MIRLNNLAYPLYRLVRGVARLTGLDKPLRNHLGALAGRAVFSASSSAGSPAVVHGHKMVLGSSDSYPPVDMATGRYEPETTRQFESLIQPGMVVIDVGAHVVEVGPILAPSAVEIETYSVTITSHVSGEDTVPEGEPIVFTAETDPPGYETEITWLSSTKYGTAEPILGEGLALGSRRS